MQLDVDGRRVFAATGGRPFDPELPAVVFVHGASMNRTVWALQARYFAHHGRAVLAPDLPGHGASEGPPLESVEEIADWLVRLMDAAGVREAALAGHSMGSLPVIEAAARHPDRVRAVCLLGTSIPMPVADTLLENAKANKHAAYDMVTSWGHSRAAQIGGNRAPGLWVTGAGLRLLERDGDDVLYIDMTACNDYTTGLEAAAKVRCPVRIVLGDGDMMTPPRNAQPLIDALDGPEVIILKRCGHMMMAEQPDETLDALIGAV